MRSPSRRAAAFVAACAVIASSAASAQEITYRGFAEAGVTLYPQETPIDSTQAVVDAILRFDPSLQIGRRMRATASFDARVGSHDHTSSDISFWDRTIRRPALAVRTASMSWGYGPLSVELGKQFVRWGQSDILSPTDHFTPRDYLVPVNSEVLATTSARITYAPSLETSLELVYVPRLTPSRIPFLDQRWIGLDAAAVGLPLRDGEIDVPGGGQVGVRVHHIGRRVEFSGTFFHGYRHLPVLDVALAPAGNALVVDRRFPAIRAVGGDAVVPTAMVTLRAEAAWVESKHDEDDDFGLWVAQAERQQGSWLLLGGYVGEWVTEERDARTFAPDRGLARSVVGRASYTSETGQTFVLEAIARRNGDGLYLKSEYSRGIGSRWRLTFQGLLIRGAPDDFFGQYRRNSWGRSRARFSF